MFKQFLGAISALAVMTAAVHAEEYPTRPIEVIVPSPPGGGTDNAARLLMEVTKPFLKTDLVVQNKPGGGGTVGTAVFVQARPDGYTLEAFWNSPITVAPHSLPVPYTPDSYQSVMRISSTPMVICGAKDFPASNAKEFLAEIGKKPDAYTFGNDGVGGLVQLAFGRIFLKEGLKVRPVPFGGAGETLKNFLGGHVTFYAGSISPIRPYVESGEAKCFLVSSAERNEALPNVEGLKEVGLEGEETLIWRGILAPKGTPAEKIKVLEEAFRKGADTDKFKEFLKTQGEELWLAGAEESDAYLRQEYKALGEVAKAIGLTK